MRPIFQPRLVNGPFGDPALFDLGDIAAFTWNLVENHAVELGITAHDVTADGLLRRASFNSRERFARRELPPLALEHGRRPVEPAFEVRCAVLDHRVRGRNGRRGTGAGRQRRAILEARHAADATRRLP